MSRILLAVSTLLLTIGCSSSDIPPERVPSSVTGEAIDARIREGLVRAFVVNTDGTKGDEIAEPVLTSDVDGSYDIKLKPSNNRVTVMLELTAGWYPEEATGKIVNLKEHEILRALFDYEYGSEPHITISPATNLAAGLALCQHEKDNLGLGQSIIQSTNAVADMFANTDILYSTPIDITDDGAVINGLTNSVKYGFVLAAFSKLTEKWAVEQGLVAHEDLTSISLHNLMYDDIRYGDCQLDGVIQRDDRVRKASFAGGELNGNSFRAELARAMIEIARTEQNKTGITAVDLVNTAEVMAMNEGIYGGQSPELLDDQPPTIIPNFRVGGYFSGDQDFSVSFDDFVGVERAQISIGEYYQDAFRPTEGVELKINTRILEEGEHVVTVAAIDYVQNDITETFPINISNRSAFLNMTSPSVVNTAEYVFEATYDDHDIGIDKIVVEGNDAEVLADSKIVRQPITLVPGENSIGVQIHDESGFVTHAAQTVFYDSFKPIMEPLGHSDVTILVDGIERSVPLTERMQEEGPILIDPFNLELGDTLIDAESLSARNIPFYHYEVSDIDARQDNAAVDSILIEYLIGEEILSTKLIDKPGYNAKLVVPFVAEYLGNDFRNSQIDDVHTVRITLRDESGNEFKTDNRFHVYIDSPKIQFETSFLSAEIAVFSVDEKGAKSGFVGECRTDEAGSCVFNYAEPSSILLAEVSGGRYLEAASESYLSEVGSLSAYFDYLEADRTVTITPITTIEAGYVRGLAREYADINVAYQDAHTAFSQQYGFDITHTRPANILDASEQDIELTVELQYGFLLGGISHFSVTATNSPEIFHSVALANILKLDAEDLVMDGFDGAGNLLSLGQVALDSGFYRSAHLASTLAIAQSDLNRTQISHVDLIDMVSDVNTNPALFETNPPAIDDVPPSISMLTTDYATINNTSAFQVSVGDDMSYVASVEFFVSTPSIERVRIESESNNQVVVDSSMFQDGDYSLWVVATDAFGNIAEQNYDGLIDNTAPTIALASDTLTNQSVIEIEGTVEDILAGLNSGKVLVNGDAATIDFLSSGDPTRATWRADVVLEEGNNRITIEAIDSLGNIGQIVEIIAADFTVPEVRFSSVSHLALYQNEVGKVYEAPIKQTNENDPMYFTTETIALNGVDKDDINALGQASRAFFTIVARDQTGADNVKTDIEDMRYTWTYKKGDEVVFSDQVWLADDSTIVIPIAQETLHEDWYKTTPDDVHTILFKATDEAGNSSELELTFKAVVVPSDEIQQAFSWSFLGDVVENSSDDVFANRADLMGKQVSTVRYVFRNTSDVDLWVNFSDTSEENTLQHYWEERRKMNRYRSRTRTEYRAQFASITETTDPLSGCSADLVISPEINITEYEDYRNDDFLLTLNYEPNIVPLPNVTWTYSEWVNSAQETPVNVLPTFTAVDADSFLDGKNRHIAKKMGETITGYSQVPMTVVGYAIVDKAVDVGCTGGQTALLEVPARNRLKSRNVTIFESAPGYPIDDKNPFDAEIKFPNDELEYALGSGYSPRENAGWANVPAGNILTIYKRTTLPNFELHNDTSVSDPDFQSYEWKSLDKALYYQFGTGLEMSVVVDNGAHPELSQSIAIVVNDLIGRESVRPQ